MNSPVSSPRRRRVAATATSLLAALALASPAHAADSAIGAGTTLGNAVNPTTSRGEPRDANWPAAKHTPTGQQFRLPSALPDVRQTASGWQYSGHLEFGWLGGDADEENARFRMYQDVDEGAYLNRFNFEAHQPKGGYHVELSGGAAGRDDQYYGLLISRANAWKVKAFFNEVPHVFTDRYKSLWNGIGTGNLTLLPGLTPGGTASTAADNAAVLAAANAGTTALSLKRSRAGIRVDLDFAQTWKAYAGYSLEQRTGARPFGAVWGNSGGTAPIEIAEPVDYDTQDIYAGLQHASGLNAFNLRFNASIFTNHIDTVTFEEPYRITPAAGVTTVPAAGAFTRGRMDLAPSNDAYNVRAEYTRSLPQLWRGYLTAVAALGTWRQDDNLIPYTAIPNVTQTNVSLQPGGAWDSVTALSRRTSDAAIDTRLADVTLSVNPTAALNLKGKARFYEADNQTDPFLAVNPNAVYVDADAIAAGNQTRGVSYGGLTGVLGRPLNDGSGQSILFGNNANPAGNIAIGSLPYSLRQYRVGGTADYRFSRVVSVNALLERETSRRTYRDRDRTWDDRVKLGVVHRGLGDATVRGSYEFVRRRGSTYRPTAYGDGFSAMIVAFPTAAGTNVNTWIRGNSGLRTYDLADRDQHTLTARLDTSLRRDLDGGFSLQLRDVGYPASPYGRKDERQGSLNVDLSYQPGPGRSLYVFASTQTGRSTQNNIAQANANLALGGGTALGTLTPDNAVAIGSAPGGPLYPLLNYWEADHKDRNHVLGFGLHQQIGTATLALDYSYAVGRSRIGYRYTVGGALNAANAALAGERMPDIATDTQFLDASLRFPLTARLSARLVARWQQEDIRDWHYRNVDATPVVLGGQGAAALPTTILLDGGPYDYNAKWFGVVFQLKL